MTKITLSGGTTFELSAEQLRELGAKIAEAVEGKTGFSVGDFVKLVSKDGEPNAIATGYDIGGIYKIEGVNTASRGRHCISGGRQATAYVSDHHIEHATAEEVAEYERNRIFTENGRKPNEYRKGDIVIYVGDASTNGMAVEVCEDTEDGLTAIKWHKSVRLGVCTEESDAITPLVFVEQRLDRKH